MCFLGHGMVALGKNPAWIPYLETVGIYGKLAGTLMIGIGMLDSIIAVVVLVKPTKIIVIWACFWTFLTALMRPLSGESFWGFVERAPNWIVPVVLYIMLYKISDQATD